MGKKDERMAVTTEILNGIKYIKMSGWEKAFLQKVILGIISFSINRYQK